MKMSKISNIKLPKKFKEKWVNALLSGDFTQGHYNLKKGKGEDIQYCCMGVLCEISGESYRNSKSENPLINKKFVPESLRDNKKIQRKLAYMNDEEMRSFKYIANYINRYL